MKDEKLRKSWKQDAEGVRHEILKVAMAEFAEYGLAGARIDEIAAKTTTSKRMIYYYFGDKEGLYIAALESAYARVQTDVADMAMDSQEPKEAMATLVRFIFDYHCDHPDLVRMVMGENMNHAAFLQQSDFIRGLTLTSLRRLEGILAQGQEDGVFRDDIDPLFTYWQIQAQSFYNVANRETFSSKFGSKLFDETGQRKMREEIVTATLRYLKA